MTISRAQMGTQLEGNRMACSPKKMKKGGKVAGPEGPEGPEGPKGPTGVTGMKAGGRVSRGDGACMKGHTKGKMR